MVDLTVVSGLLIRGWICLLLCLHCYSHQYALLYFDNKQKCTSSAVNVTIDISLGRHHGLSHYYDCYLVRQLVGILQLLLPCEHGLATQGPAVHLLFPHIYHC